MLLDNAAIFFVKGNVQYSYRKSYYRSYINSTWELACSSVLMLRGSDVRTQYLADLAIQTVREVIHATSTKDRIKLETHPNPLLHPISLTLQRGGI